MIATHAAFPMYDFPELAKAHERFWRAVVANARAAGFNGDVPLTQICGYPLIRSLGTAHDVVAAPQYDVPFCEGTTHRAIIVVTSESKHARLDDLRDTCFAVNARDSNTGMNLPRRLVAPLARRGRFFRQVVITGSHAASLEAVANGNADAASIDCVTFRLLAEHRPHAVARVRTLAVTAPSPTPPFVVPRAAGSRAKTLLYDALAAAGEDPRLADARRALHLTSIAHARPDWYSALLEHENEAAALGYAVLA